MFGVAIFVTLGTRRNLGFCWSASVKPVLNQNLFSGPALILSVCSTPTYPIHCSPACNRAVSKRQVPLPKYATENASYYNTTATNIQKPPLPLGEFKKVPFIQVLTMQIKSHQNPLLLVFGLKVFWWIPPIVQCFRLGHPSLPKPPSIAWDWGLATWVDHTGSHGLDLLQSFYWSTLKED